MEHSTGICGARKRCLFDFRYAFMSCSWELHYIIHLRKQVCHPSHLPDEQQFSLVELFGIRNAQINSQWLASISVGWQKN